MFPESGAYLSSGPWKGKLLEESHMPESGAPRSWLDAQFGVVGHVKQWGNPSTGGHSVPGRGRGALSPASRVQEKQGCCILPWGHFYSIATRENFHREKGGVFLQ